MSYLVSIVAGVVLGAVVSVVVVACAIAPADRHRFVLDERSVRH
jgi:hypothetical protein